MSLDQGISKVSIMKKDRHTKFMHIKINHSPKMVLHLHPPFVSFPLLMPQDSIFSGLVYSMKILAKIHKNKNIK